PGHRECAGEWSISDRDEGGGAVAGWSDAGADCVTCGRFPGAAGAGGIAIVGDYFAYGSNSVGDVAAAGRGFSSREFGWAGEHYSGGVANGDFCAVGIVAFGVADVVAPGWVG